MNITSATFIKGLVGDDEALHDGKAQIAFIGRSNVGKSSVINTVANKKDLAKTSSFPGRTQQINLFLINKDFYLVDLPGYGYAKGSMALQKDIQTIIYHYLLDPQYVQKYVVLIIDAYVGPTANDMAMLNSLEQAKKKIIIVANKIDKVKKNLLKQQLKTIQDEVGNHKVIPYSAEKKIGVRELADAILE